MHLRQPLLLLVCLSLACGDDDGVGGDASTADATPPSSSSSLTITRPTEAIAARRADISIAYDVGDATVDDIRLELRVRGFAPTVVELDGPSGEQVFPDVLLYEGDAPEAEVALGARLLQGEEVRASTALTLIVSLAAEAQQRLEEAAPGTSIGRGPNGEARRLSTDLALAGDTPEARARSFMEEYGVIFGVEDPTEARLARSRTLVLEEATYDRVVLRQVHAGAEVIGARAAFTFAGERLSSASFRWAHGLGPLARDLIGPTEALAIVGSEQGVSDPSAAGRPRLGWWDDRISLPIESRPDELRAPEPVWQLRLPVSPSVGASFTLHAFVGAVSGEVLESWSTSRGDAPGRVSHDLEGTEHADCQSMALFGYLPYVECVGLNCRSSTEPFAQGMHVRAGRAGRALDELDAGLAALRGYDGPAQLQLFARDRDPAGGDAGPHGSYDAQCDFIRIGSDDNSSRLIGHEVAHAFIEETVGLGNEGSSGAVAEGLAYFLGAHVVGEGGGERCELTCEGFDPEGVPLVLAEYLQSLPGVTHRNGRIVQMPLELLAIGGRFPESHTDPLTPDGTYAGIGADAAAQLVTVAMAGTFARDGVVDFFDELLSSAALLESAGFFDEGQECNVVLAIAETAFTFESWSHALFSDPARFAQFATCLDGDPDGDLVPSNVDLCPLLTGDDQSADLDGDGQGDECDLDRDGDGTPNANDLCPDTPTASRLHRDRDRDGLGDLCDDDDDGDGVPDADDVCPTFAQESPADCADDDGDGIINGRDRCPDLPFTPSDDLSDIDGDGLGAACDDDDDGDGVRDAEDLCPGVEGGADDEDGDGLGDSCDLCPGVADAEAQTDSDWDGRGDACDDDDDDDGIADAADNCPLVANASQTDLDDNGLGIACDGPELQRFLANGEVAVLAEADVSVTLPICQEDCALEAATEGGWSISLTLPAEAEVSPAVIGSFGEVIAWLEPQSGDAGADVVYTGEWTVSGSDLALWGEDLSWSAPTYSLVLDPAGSPELSLPGPMIVQLVIPGGTPPVCGDDDAGAGEVCDGSDLRGLRCTTLGFDSGTLACDGCAYDTSACGRCGDGRRSSDETCDGDDFGADSCVARGFVGGSLSCGGGCSVISDAGCTPCTTQEQCADLGANGCLVTGRCGTCAVNTDCPSPLQCLAGGFCLMPF